VKTPFASGCAWRFGPKNAPYESEAEKKREERPAESKTGDNAQRNKDDRTPAGDDKSNKE